MSKTHIEMMQYINLQNVSVKKKVKFLIRVTYGHNSLSGLWSFVFHSTDDVAA